MDLRVITDNQKDEYNQRVTHVMQSWQWGEFRKKLGLPLLRFGIYQDNQLITPFQLTLHKIPFTQKFIGYLPKGPLPDEQFTKCLLEIGRQHSCVAIKVEPNILKKDLQSQQIAKTLKLSNKALFTKDNFILNLEKSEEEILKEMHPKTRYNIKVAQKHHVVIEERTDDEGFEIYLKLYFSTTLRQKYHGHNERYHRLVWQTLKSSNMARVLIAFYTPPDSTERIALSAWMLFNFQETLYYPYGGSSEEYRNTMASTLIAWEAIKLGKRLDLKTFDLWGALPPNADPHHPWQGFHRFKESLGAELIEYIGTYDLILSPTLYHLFSRIDRITSLKVFLLKILGK